MECRGCAPSDLVFSSIPESLHEKEESERVDENESHGIQLEKKRIPKRILHFSDGVLEEYSSDEETATPVKPITSEINPKTLPWGPWVWYQTVAAGAVSLQVCDYLGEHLASFFGITSPKYQYEIDEYNRMVAEEEEKKKKQDLEMGGWSNHNQESTSTVEVEEPQQTKL